MALSIAKSQLAAAIAVAVTWRLFRDAFAFVASLKKALAQQSEVAPEIVLQRRTFCLTCRIWFRPLKTCDSPFRRKRWPTPGVPEGCLCNTDAKSRTKCNCPLYDRGGIEGWPEQLNSFPVAA